MKGGARPGAGRPIGSLKTNPLRPHMQAVMTKLTDPQRELFKQLGGAKWLREYLERLLKRDQKRPAG